MNFMPTKRSPLGHVEHFELILHISAWSSTCGQNVHWPTGTMPCRMWGLHATRTKKTDCPIQPQAQRPLVSYNEQIEQSWTVKVSQQMALVSWIVYRQSCRNRAQGHGYLEGNLKHRSPKGGGAKKDPNAGVNSTYSGCQESKAFSFQRFPNCLDSLDYLMDFLGCFGFWGQRMPAKLFPLSISLHVTAFLQVPEFMDLWSDTRFASVRLTGYHVRGTLESL